MYSPVYSDIFGDRVEINPVSLSEEEQKRMSMAKRQRIRYPIKRQPENNAPRNLVIRQIALPRLIHYENEDYPEDNGFYAVFSLAGIDILPASRLRLDPHKAIGITEKWGLVMLDGAPWDLRNLSKPHVVSAMKKTGALVYMSDILNADGTILEKHCQTETQYNKARQIAEHTEWFSPYFMPVFAIRRFMRVSKTRVAKLKNVKEKDLIEEGYENIEEFKKYWDSKFGPKYKIAGRYRYDNNPWIETADVVENKTDYRKGIDIDKI